MINYLCVFVVYLFVGYLFFLTIYEKAETFYGVNLFDVIGLEAGMKPDPFFKLLVVLTIMLTYPVIIVLGEFDV